MPDKTCKPFSVEVAILTPDDKREILFGLTKGCNPDDTSFWLIDFILKEKKGEEMKKRVEVHVTVGENKKPKAEELAASKQLSEGKTKLLQGKIKDRALELKPGTTADPELEKMLAKLL